MFPCPVLNVNVLLHVCSCLPCVTPVWTIVRIYPSSPHSLLLSVGNHDWTPDQQRTLFPRFVQCFFFPLFSPWMPLSVLNTSSSCWSRGNDRSRAIPDCFWTLPPSWSGYWRETDLHSPSFSRMVNSLPSILDIFLARCSSKTNRKTVPEHQSPLRQAAQQLFPPGCESPEHKSPRPPLKNPMQTPTSWNMDHGPKGPCL